MKNNSGFGALMVLVVIAVLSGAAMMAASQIQNSRKLMMKSVTSAAQSSFSQQIQQILDSPSTCDLNFTATGASQITLNPQTEDFQDLPSGFELTLLDDTKPNKRGDALLKSGVLYDGRLLEKLQLQVKYKADDESGLPVYDAVLRVLWDTKALSDAGISVPASEDFSIGLKLNTKNPGAKINGCTGQSVAQFSKTLGCATAMITPNTTDQRVYQFRTQFMGASGAAKDKVTAQNYTNVFSNYQNGKHFGLRCNRAENWRVSGCSIANEFGNLNTKNESRTVTDRHGDSIKIYESNPGDGDVNMGPLGGDAPLSSTTSSGCNVDDGEFDAQLQLYVTCCRVM